VADPLFDLDFCPLDLMSIHKISSTIDTNFMHAFNE
jgi:hypothetical protein